MFPVPSSAIFLTVNTKLLEFLGEIRSGITIGFGYVLYDILAVGSQSCDLGKKPQNMV